jgi:hypothetical protein
MKKLQSQAIPRFLRRWYTLCVALPVLACLLAGCLPTGVQPFYRTSDVIQDPALLGTWKDKPDGTTGWTFTAGAGKSYALEIVGDDQRAVCVAHLFTLGKERFLDICPAKAALEQNLEKNVYALALIPGHVFVRVRATEPALRMSGMGLDWLREELKKNPNALDHYLSEDRVVFTGSTEDMQSFIKQHLSDSAAWNDLYDDGLVKVRK